MTPYLVVIWACAISFLATALVTLLALVGKVTLGGGNGSKHHYYLRKLFATLIIQIAGAGVATFALYLKQPQQTDVVAEDVKHWERGTAHWERAQKEIADPTQYAASLDYALKEYRLALARGRENPDWAVHVATVLNELGRYSEAENILRRSVKWKGFSSASQAARGWSYSELAVALELQGKRADAETYRNSAYEVGENFRDYIEGILKKYRTNDARRNRQ